MKADHTRPPTAWKRRALAASVVATAVSAVIPWGQIKPGHGNGNDQRKSHAGPGDTSSDQSSSKLETSSAAERLPNVALVAPVGGAPLKAGPRPQHVEKAMHPLEQLDAMGPRKRLIAPRLQTGGLPSVLPHQTPESSFHELADGVYQVGGAQAGDSTPLNGEAMQADFASRNERQDVSQAFASERTAFDNAQGIAVPIEGATAGPIVANGEVVARTAGDGSLVSPLVDNPSEVGMNPAVAAEAGAAARTLASNNDEATVPEGNSMTSPPVDVPDEAITNIAERGAGPSITSKHASNEGSSGAPNVDLPAPNTDAMRSQPDSLVFAGTDPALSDVDGEVPAQYAAQARVQLAQSSLPVRINDVWVGNVPFIIDARDQLSVSLAGLLDIVGTRMQPDRFRELRSSRAASGYASFDTLRKAGFTVKFDKETESLTLSAQTGGTARN